MQSVNNASLKLSLKCDDGKVISEIATDSIPLTLFYYGLKNEALMLYSQGMALVKVIISSTLTLNDVSKTKEEVNVLHKGENPLLKKV